MYVSIERGRATTVYQLGYLSLWHHRSEEEAWTRKHRGPCPAAWTAQWTPDGQVWM